MSKINIGGYEITVHKDYSTTEQFTGQYWIDGRPIYRKTFLYSSQTLTSQSKTWSETVANNIERAWIANGSYWLMKSKNTPNDIFYTGGAGYIDSAGNSYSSMRMQYLNNPYSNTITLEFWTGYYNSYTFEVCFVVEYVKAG